MDGQTKKTPARPGLENLFLGTSGWSYPDWQGVVYPKRIRGTDQLAYLSEYLDCVEINTSFYHPLNPAYAERWIAAVAGRPRFQFAAKLWQGFTHNRESGWTPGDVRRAKEGLKILLDAGRLSALLMQFPWSFRPTPENLDYLDSLLGEFGEFPLVAEVRNAAWDCEDADDFFRARGIGLCAVDQPAMKGNLALKPKVTSPVAYFRLHGRNAKTWFNDAAGGDSGSDTGRHARYDYLYGEDELREIAGKVLEAMERAGRTFLFANNHPKGKALGNVIQIKAMLEGGLVRVPDAMLEAFPQLRPLAKPPDLSFG
ncbi:MAG TPA: DUF72 domain-containing protein [Candidatus Brocadiia bacterium]|nr:DUF72 domain-containing protein [Candidatus Brocadiia bacterium]